MEPRDGESEAVAPPASAAATAEGSASPAAAETPPTAPELLAGGLEAYGRMWRMIEGARHAVDLETYIYRQGAVGDRFRQLLAAAAARGVRVRVLVDACGSNELPDRYFDPLERAGGEVRRFNPKRMLRFSFRNHRKLLRCDEGAVVGGLNIADEYDGDGVSRGWRDFAIAVASPVVGPPVESFERMWELASFGRESVSSFWRHRPRSVPAGPTAGQLLLSGPGCPSSELRRTLVSDIRGARSFRAWAAYFVPSRRIGVAIRSVARRGDAQVVLGARTDVPVSRWASERLFARFLRAGVRIHDYVPQIVHAKVLIIDDLVYVGSANLDVRSLRINYELLLRIRSSMLAERLREQFALDVARSNEVLPAEWRARRRWWRVLRSYLAWLLIVRVDPYVATRKLQSLG
jgi:cardiolipin synthase A/B